MWLLLLSVSLLQLRLAEDSVVEQGRYWQQGDVRAADRLVELSRFPDDLVRAGAVNALIPLSSGPAVDAALEQRYKILMETAEVAGADRSVLVRQAGGALFQRLERWKLHESPEARRKEERRDFRARLRDYLLVGFIVLMTVCGAFSSAAARFGPLGRLLFWTEELPRSGPAFRQLLRRSPAFMALPFVFAAAIAAAFFPIVAAMASLQPSEGLSELGSLGFAALGLVTWLWVPALAAWYVSALALQAALSHGMLAGRGFGAALRATARCLPELAELGWLAGDLSRALRGALPVWERLSGRADWLREKGASHRTALVAGLIVVDGLPLEAALDRVQVICPVEPAKESRLGDLSYWAAEYTGGPMWMLWLGGAIAAVFLIGELISRMAASSNAIVEAAAATVALAWLAGACAMIPYAWLLMMRTLLAVEIRGGR